MASAKFLLDNHEDGDFNQYWYSEHTISKIVEALVRNDGRIAFLSTPSLYFSLPEETKARAYVFDVSRECDASSAHKLLLAYYFIQTSFGIFSSIKNGLLTADSFITITTNPKHFLRNSREHSIWSLLIHLSLLTQYGRVMQLQSNCS